MPTLDAELLKAHATNDKRGLVTLYAKAAEATQIVDAKCFFLTHAYIFALDVGDVRADELHSKLKMYGRED